MTDEITFEVGGKYENMKGVFEVIAIQTDTMDIRWEDGEEISTPIDLQRRIIERMRFEKELEESLKAQKKKKSKAHASKSGKQFAGFEVTDFTNSVSKTNWRGRGQLGGAVATQIKSDQYTFNSWAVLRKPEVTWLDVKRQKQKDAKFQARFFARLEAANLFYGFHVPTADSSIADTSDLQQIRIWLEQPENESWLVSQLQDHELTIRDASGQGFVGEIVVTDGQCFHVSADQEKKSVDSIHKFLDAPIHSGKIDLRIEKKISKDAAVEKKQNIAGEIASLAAALIPLYAAAATMNS